MTATALKKHFRYITNAKGQKTDLLINLKNKQVREAVEDWLDTQEAMARLQDGQECITWEEVKKHLYDEEVVK